MDICGQRLVASVNLLFASRIRESGGQNRALELPPLSGPPYIKDPKDLCLVLTFQWCCH
jgi:hypothetical protein